MSKIKCTKIPPNFATLPEFRDIPDIQNIPDLTLNPIFRSQLVEFGQYQKTPIVTYSVSIGKVKKKIPLIIFMLLIQLKQIEARKSYSKKA